MISHQEDARPGPAGAPPTGPARVRLDVLVVFTLATAAGAAVRIWQLGGRSSLSWADSGDFLAGSSSPWLSLELWAGERPPLATVVLKLLGGDMEAYVVWQGALAVTCWAALAASVSTAVVDRRGGWLAALAVVAFSVTVPVTMWERSVLSESLALSLLALMLAAGVQLARGVTGWRVAALLAALAPWLAARDSHLVVALAGGAAVVAAVALSWLVDRRSRHRATRGASPPPSTPDALPPPSAPGTSAPPRRLPGAPAPRRALAVLGLGALGLGLVAALGSSHGERHAFPMRNVYEVRVLPYPDRVDWFADRGMPQAEHFVGPDARPSFIDPLGGPPVVYVPDDDAELGPWLEWVESGGRTAFVEFVATHPLYLVSEPLRSPERAFNNAHGDRGFYVPPDMPEVPGIGRLLTLPTSVVLLVGALAGGWAIGRGRRTPPLVAGAAAAALAVPHGLVAWHSDGMETARHLVVPAAQLHLGVLLMMIGALETVVGAGAPRAQVGDPGGDPGGGPDES
jgi:hypothetical protein